MKRLLTIWRAFVAHLNRPMTARELRSFQVIHLGAKFCPHCESTHYPVVEGRTDVL